MADSAPQSPFNWPRSCLTQGVHHSLICVGLSNQDKKEKLRRSGCPPFVIRAVEAGELPGIPFRERFCQYVAYSLYDHARLFFVDIVIAIACDPDLTMR